MKKLRIKLKKGGREGGWRMKGRRVGRKKKEGGGEVIFR